MGDRFSPMKNGLFFLSFFSSGNRFIKIIGGDSPLCISRENFAGTILTCIESANRILEMRMEEIGEAGKV
jgi:hypothetical protein